MAFGYHNRILRVDLSTNELAVDEPGDSFFRTYLGGWGIIGQALLKLMPAEANPLGPENVLVFAPGLVTGAPLGGSGRHAVGAKSPLTGAFGAAEAGGFWGAELKRAGWDAIIFTGMSPHPVYLSVVDDEVELHNAEHLWGQPTADVEQIIHDELDDRRVRVAQCGLAGEKLVRFACVMHDVNRAAGRTGLGAVMGAKHLKAVAVRGTGRAEMADEGRVRTVARWLTAHWPEFAQRLHDHGTLGGLIILDRLGALPTCNFQQGTFAGAERITGETMTATILVDRDTCFACPVYCKRRVQVRGEHQADPVYGGPEYETAAALGSLCGIDDLEAIAYANQLCNAYGLDTISTGVTIAWAMECFERGLLTVDDTSGLPVRFGDPEAMLCLIEQIACRQAFGTLLAEGSGRASRALGRGSERYAMHVKDQEIPMHDPRIKFGMDIGYAVSPTGADHNHNVWDHVYTADNRYMQSIRSLGILHPLRTDELSPEKLRLAYYHTDWIVLLNCLGLCTHLPYSKEQVRDLVCGMTGWNATVFELMKAGERAMAMARAFNHRQGLSAEDDVAHWRLSEPLADGPSAGAKVPKDEARQAIYAYRAMRGWDNESGAPIPEKLDELGLSWVNDLLQ